MPVKPAPVAPVAPVVPPDNNNVKSGELPGIPVGLFTLATYKFPS
jgi:hypothetical protein